MQAVSLVFHCVWQVKQAVSRRQRFEESPHMRVLDICRRFAAAASAAAATVKFAALSAVLLMILAPYSPLLSQ